VFATVSASCDAPERAHAAKRVVFLGAGDVAEIGYAALRQTDLTLVAVVDDERGGMFFEHAIRSGAELRGSEIAGVPFDRLIVMMVNPAPHLAGLLRSRSVPRERICWLKVPAAGPVQSGFSAGFGSAAGADADRLDLGPAEIDPA
jgi:hypothetical protein